MYALVGRSARAGDAVAQLLQPSTVVDRAVHGCLQADKKQEHVFSMSQACEDLNWTGGAR